VIEPTDEMVIAAMEAFNSTGAYEPVVKAVLAIVERDYAGRVAVDPEDLRIALNQQSTHAHVVPGRWDGTGAACHECAARSRLYAALFEWARR
jgi:hypothetical protein